MNVFVPHKKDANIYLDEIMAFSKNNFVFGDYTENDTSFKIINIHFPDAIFDWKLPNSELLEALELQFQKWKQNAKIVYTLNDFTTHYDKYDEFSVLFKMVHKYADGVIHLGKYSLDNYSRFFSKNCLHTVIYHPLYDSLTKLNSKDIQALIPVDLKDKYIVSVIGNIRSIEEMRLIIKIFKKLPIKNKILIVPRMLRFVSLPKYCPYRFRNVYKFLFVRIHTFPLSDKQYFFNDKFLDYPFITDLVKRSSLMIIPRIRNLNSGNLFLGLTFDKPMIMPAVGNLTEIGNLFKFPSFDLKKNNLNEVIHYIVNSKKADIFGTEEYISNKKLFHPREIARQYDDFFNLLLNKI